MIIGSDIGYGFVKTYYVNGTGNSGRSDIFPTAVSPYVPKPTFGDSPEVVTVGDCPFSVGLSAQQEGRTISTRRGDFIGSREYLAVLGYALYRTISSPRMLVLGLPPGMFTRERTAAIGGQLRQSRIVLPEGRPVALGDIRFVPQGAGVFFAHVSGSVSDFRRKLVVLDCGYYTVDMVFFNRGKYVEGAVQSRPLGLAEVYERVKRRFYQEHRAFLKSDGSAETLLREGHIEIAGVRFALETRDLLEFYQAQIRTALESYIETLPDEVDAVIAGGGGVGLLGPEEGRGKYDLLVVKDPQVANARGYYEYGRQILGN